jgi:aerobic-type carbon monoxide dehydrogenase small subunit (CoxS/CutS family)
LPDRSKPYVGTPRRFAVATLGGAEPATDGAVYCQWETIRASLNRLKGGPVLRRPAAGWTARGIEIMANIKVNGTSHQIDVEGNTPLLWVLREELGLTGTKFGCGIAQCGACTVHVNGEAIRSCSVPISTVEGAEITTIEGLSSDSTHPVQQAWLTEQVPQCGYCQSGQIMATVAYLKSNPNPTDADIDANLTNICRCGTYERLRRAVHRAAALIRG